MSPAVKDFICVALWSFLTLLACHSAKVFAVKLDTWIFMDRITISRLNGLSTALLGWTSIFLEGLTSVGPLKKMFGVLVVLVVLVGLVIWGGDVAYTT